MKDSAVDFGLAPDLGAHFARDELELEQVGISYQHLAPGAAQPFAHRHESHEEVYVVVGGSGRMQLDDETIDVARLDAVRVAAGTTRAFAAGPDGLEWLVLGPHGPDPFESLPAPFAGSG